MVFAQTTKLSQMEDEHDGNWKFSRRDALKGAGAVGAVGASRCEPALAQSGRVVVGTWGGDYARLLAKNIEDPLLKPKGFEVAQDQAGDGPRRTKMVAEKRLPRGTSDIQGLSAAQHVRDERGRRARDDRLFQAAERQEPDRRR